MKTIVRDFDSGNEACENAVSCQFQTFYKCLSTMMKSKIPSFTLSSFKIIGKFFTLGSGRFA